MRAWNLPRTPMKASKTVASYRRLRNQPLWSLLAATQGPIVLALLKTHLLDSNRSLSASSLLEHLERDLEELRAQGLDLPRTAQAYVAEWLASGYLERRFLPGAGEEEYELSAAAVGAIRFVASLDEPRRTATESRLSTIIVQLVRLAEETDSNPATRIATLQAERERIDREIEQVRQGRLECLAPARALERIREIITLADELTADFRCVRDQFEQLNRELRQQVVENEGGRGQVLEALFTGVDVIAESEEGRTFAAFWRLLLDPEQSASLELAIEEVLERKFATRLASRERQFLLTLTRTLLEQGGSVHDTLQQFARSLKHFVESREYLEHRRVNNLIREAQKAALGLKEEVRATEALHYSLMLSSCRIRSLSQWSLHDPSVHTMEKGMPRATPSPTDANALSHMLAHSEIDFRTLKANIRAVLQERAQASIGEVMERFPARQGLGSLVGYLALGSRHGMTLRQNDETVSWVGEDRQHRRASIPVVYFQRERVHELV